jgi:hypothetical protein
MGPLGRKCEILLYQSHKFSPNGTIYLINILSKHDTSLALLDMRIMVQLMAAAKDIPYLWRVFSLSILIVDQYIRIPATSATSKDSPSFVFVGRHLGKVVGHPHRIMQRENCGIDPVTTPRTFLSTLRRGVKSHHFGLLGLARNHLEVVRASACFTIRRKGGS